MSASRVLPPPLPLPLWVGDLMSGAVKLSSGLPDGEPNGLASIVAALITDPAELTCVVMLIDTKKLEQQMRALGIDTDTGEVSD